MSRIVSTLYKHIWYINIIYLWHITLWWETSLVYLSMDIQNANRTCSFYHRKQTHHIKRSIPGSNAWIPKVAHIWTHLIFKLKMSPYSHILTHNKFMIFDFLLLRSNNKISFNWETFFLNLHSRHIKHFL